MIETEREKLKFNLKPKLRSSTSGLHVTVHKNVCVLRQEQAVPSVELKATPVTFLIESLTKTKAVFHSFRKISLKFCNAKKKLDEIQAHNTKSTNKTRNIAVASVIMGTLIIAVIAGIYLQRNLPTHESSPNPSNTLARALEPIKQLVQTLK